MKGENAMEQKTKVTLEEGVSNPPQVKPSEDKTQGPPETFLDSYRRQHSEMSSTYMWMKPRLTTAQRGEWERTINALDTVVKALEAGFAPITPPRNWASGVLLQYIAPIPEGVRESISQAEPIFGLGRILIYDPNTEHFQRPQNYDPMAIGFVDLATQRLHFLIGLWDIKADLKFIEGTRRIEGARRTVEGLIGRARENWGPRTTPPAENTSVWADPSYISHELTYVLPFHSQKWMTSMAPSDLNLKAWRA